MFLLMLGCFPNLEPPDGLEGVPWRDYDDDGIALQDDCDDEDAAVHPNAVEVANGIDDDCDRIVDEGWDTGCVDTVWFLDQDGDGWGDDDTPIEACERPTHAVARGGDCGPEDPFMNPDAEEICGDDIDQNCTPGDCGAWAGELSDAVLTVSGADGRRLGSSVLVGDVNDDGALDLVAGAGGDSTRGDYAGAVFQWLNVDVDGGQMGSVTAAYPPQDDEAALGGSLALGDVDGVEGTDLIAGALRWDNGQGAVYLVAGASATRVITGTQSWSSLGRSLAPGNFDNIGSMDLLVGADAMDAPDADSGAAYLYSGPLPPSNAPVVMAGSQARAFAGYSVLALNINGDDYDEAIVGEPGWQKATANTGAPGVVYIRDAVNGTTQLSHSSEPDGFGRALAAGDLDGGGVHDLVASAWVLGEVAIYDTADWSLIGTARVPAGTDEMDGGMVVCDVTGDGVSDLVVTGSWSENGHVWLFHGPITSLDRPPDTTITGTQNGPLGGGVDCGDLNGDGFDDLFVGAGYNSTTADGAVYVFLGGRD